MRNAPYETFTHNGYTVEIWPDTDAEPPNNSEDDLFIVTTRNRYFEQLRNGNESAYDVCHDPAYNKRYHSLPLYMYAHSGVALSLGRNGQFSDPWDSGQVGLVCVQKGAGFRNIRKAAECYIEEWNQYLSGDVWYVKIADPLTGQEIDSCGRCYGLKFAKQEAISNVPKNPPAPVPHMLAMEAL